MLNILTTLNMLQRSRVALTVVLLVAGFGMASLRAQPAVATEPSASLDGSLLDRYCVTCHNERLQTAGVILEGVDVTQVAAHAPVLEKVVHKLRSGQMPPMGRPRPEVAVRDAFITGLESALDREAAASPDPGRIAVHRLNRLEYVNAIRDLLALDIDPALLPADNPGIGFDNNADVLSVTPALMNRYISAAAKVSRLAIGDPTIQPAVQVYRASEWETQTVRMSEDLPFGTHGGFAVSHVFPLDGEYTFRLRLRRNFFGGTIHGIDDEHEVQFRFDDRLVERFSVGGEYRGADPGILIAIPEDDVESQKLHSYHLNADDHMVFRMAVKAGPHLVAAAFTGIAPSVSEMVPLRPRSLKNSNFDDASAPAIGSIEISSPTGATAADDTPSRQQIFICSPAHARDEEPCAREILSTLLRRAYRRPVDEFFLDQLMGVYRQERAAGTFDAGIQLALETLLSSPAFVFRIEHDPENAEPGTVYRISDIELASRLSFFLWRSLPDDELLEVATRGDLADPDVLDRQVRRMLADPKATRWMNDFVGQWLIVRNLELQEPDPSIFPEFEDNLRRAMIAETRMFFESQVRDDHSVLDLLRADYTFLNARLARHYNVPDVYGSHFRRVPVTNPARQGLLGHASILTVTSYAHRTSVVLRGKWVLENLLGAPPPPPPPNVPPLEENEPGAAPKSLRERMEQHRSNPVCASCHAPLDPIGFVLENFDAVGKWRDADGGVEIDAATTLADGTEIANLESYRRFLLDTRRQDFLRTVVEKLLAYGLGRGLEYYDAPIVRKVVRDATSQDYRWSSIIMGIVESTPFQMRRVNNPDGTTTASRVAARR